MTTKIYQSTVAAFLLSSTRAQPGIVRRFSTRGEYSQATDFYRKLRDAIARSLKQGQEIESEPFLKTIREKNRRNNYPLLISNYNHLFNSHDLKQPRVKGEKLLNDELEVSMNPVWEREEDGKLVLVFVSWKKDQPWTARLASTLLQVPALAFHEMVPDGTIFELLDLQTLTSFRIDTVDVKRAKELERQLEAFWKIYISL